jgi:ABC-type multidrug transport system fused ATPase/permease subunit
MNHLNLPHLTVYFYSIRGTLFSMNPLILNFGILFGFITGQYLDYHTVPLVMLFFPTVFFVLAFWLPETPQTLLRTQRYQEAELSFKFYRNIKSSSMLPAQKMEYEALKKMAEQTDRRLPTNDITIGDFTNKFAVKGLLIGLFLVILNMFSGCFAIITYTATIFKESGSSLEANLSSIIVAVIQILGTYCSTILVDRAGRKILLVVSSCGTSLGLAAMGAFSYLNQQCHDLSSLGWLPILSLSFVVFIASIGILPLTFVVIAEVVPNKVGGG